VKLQWHRTRFGAIAWQLSPQGCAENIDACAEYTA
jgi:hypothetical protein